jgi:TRAP transporter TAXI family solute receptor
MIRKEKVMMMSLIVVTSITFTLALVPCSSARILKFGSGATTSEWYPIAVAMSSMWEKRISDIQFQQVATGGVSAIMAANEGKVDIAVTTSYSVGDALIGKKPFKGKQTNIAGLNRIYMAYLAISVWKDSDIYKVEDLKGKRISPGLKGYSYEALIRDVLKAAGLDYSDFAKVDFLPSRQGADAMKDGHVDACGKTASKKNAFLTDLSARRPIRILPIPETIFKALKAESPGLYPTVIEKGEYNGIDADVPAVGMSLCLIVNRNLPDDLTYKMAKILAENWVSEVHPVSKILSTVQPEELALPIGVEFHPGALRYYKERGWIK